MDAEKRVEMDRLTDLGFERTDRIEEAAEAATRSARHPKRKSATALAAADVGINDHLPPMRPASSMPTVEEWI